MKRILFSVVAVLVLLADQVSKWWIASHYPVGDEIPIWPPILYLLHARNDGVAFSLFRHHTDLFSLVAIAFCVGMVVWGRNLITRSTFMAFSMGLLLGGAVGNLVDRIRLHYVVDFIQVNIGRWYQWPTFNVADSAITTGMIMLALYFLTEAPEPDPPDGHHPDIPLGMNQPVHEPGVTVSPIIGGQGGQNGSPILNHALEPIDNQTIQ